MYYHKLYFYLKYREIATNTIQKKYKTLYIKGKLLSINIINLSIGSNESKYRYKSANTNQHKLGVCEIIYFILEKN